MKAIFFETSSFTQTVGSYLNDDQYRDLQQAMVRNPEMGAVIPGTGGFRKLRWVDDRRGKGKRGGLRVIYYWISPERHLWMFAVYDKDELENLSPDQKKQLKNAIEAELEQRGAK